MRLVKSACLWSNLIVQKGNSVGQPFRIALSVHIQVGGRAEALPCV